uniref:Uncharacterized protein n=1 Tax=Oryza brachyantha TaxID=4533 RepID=J3MZ10_ORYBR
MERLDRHEGLPVFSNQHLTEPAPILSFSPALAGHFVKKLQSQFMLSCCNLDKLIHSTILDCFRRRVLSNRKA